MASDLLALSSLVLSELLYRGKGKYNNRKFSSPSQAVNYIACCLPETISVAGFHDQQGLRLLLVNQSSSAETGSITPSKETSAEILDGWMTRAAVNYVPDLAKMLTHSLRGKSLVRKLQLYVLRNVAQRLAVAARNEARIWHRRPFQTFLRFFTKFDDTDFYWESSKLPSTSVSSLSEYPHLVRCDKLVVTRENVCDVLQILISIMDFLELHFSPTNEPVDLERIPELRKKLYILKAIIKARFIEGMLHKHSLLYTLIEQGKSPYELRGSEFNDDVITWVDGPSWDSSSRIRRHHQVSQHLSLLYAPLDAVTKLVSASLSSGSLHISQIGVEPPRQFCVTQQLKDDYVDAVRGMLTTKGHPTTTIDEYMNTLHNTLESISSNATVNLPYHSEALLMRDELLIEKIPIQVEHESCLHCSRLAYFLGKHGNKYDVPNGHGIVFPWSPPPHVSQDVLDALWKDILPRHAYALEYAPLKYEDPIFWAQCPGISIPP